MPTPVGVFNTGSVYFLGLSRLLASSGYELEPVTDPIGWLRCHRDGVVVVDVHDKADLDMVVELKTEQPDSVVVTLIDVMNVATFQASMAVGAAGSIPRDAEAAEVVLAFNAAVKDIILIPAAVARVLAARGRDLDFASCLDDGELSWLRALLGGETVAELSRRIGYSEREMYRRLRRIYSRIGASGRNDALLMAVRRGWLE